MPLISNARERERERGWVGGGRERREIEEGKEERGERE
jgi:hypothetical protein